MNTDAFSPTKGQLKGSGAAGAGCGTLIVLLADVLPPSNPWKSALVLLAPTISVAVGSAYAWLRVEIERELNRREIERVVRTAKQTLTEAMQNQSTSDDHRKELQREMEGIEVLLMRAKVDRIRVLTDVPGTPGSQDIASSPGSPKSAGMQRAVRRP